MGVDTENLTEDQKTALSLIWRLDVLRYRGRLMKDGTYKRLPTRIRRFSNALPVGRVANVLEALIAMAPYKGTILFNGENYGDEISYRPITTFIKKDDSIETGATPSAQRSKSLGTYTIVQDLLLIDEVGDTFDTLEMSSCSQIIESEYHWDEAEIGDIPDGEQGITYRISGISRDSETDLFSYSLQKIQSITQHDPEQVVACTEDEVRSVETWDNVYGEGPDGYHYDTVKHNGETITIPEPCSELDGNVVEINISEQEDCTYKIQVVRVTSKENYESEYIRYRDQYIKRDVDTDKHVATGLDKNGVEYSLGMKTTYETSKNPDGTYNNRVTVETERPVESSVVEYRKTLRGFLSTIQDRNQAFSITTSGMRVGETRSSKKTEGGLYDNSISSLELIDIGKIADECQKTIFEHSHGTTENVAEKPEEEAQEAGGGKVYTQSARQTEEGSWDVTKREVTELGVEKAVVGYQKTLRGITKSVTDRNQTSPLDGSGLTVGESRSSKKTDGGLYDNTVSTPEHEDVGQIGVECQKTIFEHSHGTAENVAEKPEEEAQEAGGGKVYTQSARQTEEGSWDVTKREVTELGVEKAVVGYQKTLRGITKSVTDRNQTSPLDGSGLTVGESRSSKKTDGGLYDNTISKLEVSDVGDIGAECQKTIFEHTHSTTVNQAVAPDDHVNEAGGGKYYQRTSNMTEEGSWNIKDVEVSETEAKNAIVESSTSLRGTTVTVVNKNVESPLEESSEVGESCKSEKTPGGLYNTTHTTLSTKPVGVIETGCSNTIFEHRHTTVENSPTGAEQEAGTAGEGKYHTVSSKKTELGSWDNTSTDIEEIPVEAAEKTVQGTLHGVIVTTVNKNVMTTVPDTADVGETYKHSRNPGGTYDYTETKASSQALDLGSADSYVGENACYSEAHTEWHVQSGVLTGEKPQVNERVAVSNRKNEWGLYETEKRVETYKPLEKESQISNWITESTTQIRKKFEADDPPSLVENREELSFAINDVGTIDYVKTTYDPKEVDSGWVTWESTVESPNSIMVYNCGFRIFKNLPDVQRVKMSGNDFNISCTINRYGLYDGTATFKELKSWKTRGGGGSSDGGVGESGTVYGPPYVHLGKRYRQKFSTRLFKGTGWSSSNLANSVKSTRLGDYTIVYWDDGEEEWYGGSTGK